MIRDGQKGTWSTESQGEAGGDSLHPRAFRLWAFGWWLAIFGRPVHPSLEASFCALQPAEHCSCSDVSWGPQHRPVQSIGVSLTVSWGLRVPSRATAPYSRAPAGTSLSWGCFLPDRPACGPPCHSCGCLLPAAVRSHGPWKRPGRKWPSWAACPCTLAGKLADGPSAYSSASYSLPAPPPTGCPAAWVSGSPRRATRPQRPEPPRAVHLREPCLRACPHDMKTPLRGAALWWTIVPGQLREKDAPPSVRSAGQAAAKPVLPLVRTQDVRVPHAHRRLCM